MTKCIFILFLFFCSLQAFSQKGLLPNVKNSKTGDCIEPIQIEKDELQTLAIEDLKENEIELLLKDHNLCEILAIKVSDLLNESMLKKLKANV